MTFSSWLPDGVLTQSLPFFQLVALVDQQRDVAAVVHDQLRTLAAGMAERLVGAPPVLFERSRPSTRTPARRPRRWPPRRGPASRRCCSSPSARCAPRSTSVSISTAV